MFENARGKIAAVVAMAACCGLSMALALGLIAFSSTAVVAGVAIAVVVGCLAFMTVVGRSRHHDETARTSG